MRTVKAHFTPNPYYQGAGTWVLTDTQTGRKQHLAFWPPMTRAQFLGLARHHLRALRAPLPTDTDRRLRFRPETERDGNFWN